MRERTDVAAGRVLAAGRYILGARLGGGGTADVYRALDTVLTRPVAIKLFRPGSGVRDEQRFKQEAQLLAPLNHTGLVTVYDAGVDDDGQAYLVLQLVDGLTLRQRLARGRLNPEQASALGARLASVLAYVHSKGIVHRDVKPANVLLSAECDDLGESAHLADFGISRLVDNAHITATGLVVGTVAYMAPEQVQGAKVGPPADVYSLGLVLLECLTGRTEYPGGNAESAVARLSRRPEIPAQLPAPLRWVIEAMTADDANQRLTARKVAAVLGDGRATDEVSTDYLLPGAPTGFVPGNGPGAFLAMPADGPAVGLGGIPAPRAGEPRVAAGAHDQPADGSDGSGGGPSTGGPSTGGRSTGSRRTLTRTAESPVAVQRSRANQWWLGGTASLLTAAAIAAGLYGLNDPAARRTNAPTGSDPAPQQGAPTQAPIGEGPGKSDAGTPGQAVPAPGAGPGQRPGQGGGQDQGQGGPGTVPEPPVPGAEEPPGVEASPERSPVIDIRIPPVGPVRPPKDPKPSKEPKPPKDPKPSKSPKNVVDLRLDLALTSPRA